MNWISIVPAVQAGPILNETTEAFFALVVRVIVAALLTAAPPKWKEKWEKAPWRNAVLFGLSFVFVPMLFWLLRCPGGVPIPGYVPRCSFAGVVLDALYPGFMAFMLNYVTEDVINWARRRKRDNIVTDAIQWLNNVWFWIFVATVIFEFFLLQIHVSWEISLAISIIFSIVATGFGLILQAHHIRGNGISFFAVTAFVPATEYLWWVVLIVKIIVHILPLPFWLKPIISIGLTLVLFVLVNLVIYSRVKAQEECDA